MSDAIKHECGIAIIRLLKPLEYYEQKYGTWQWAMNKLYLLMEKQHNRGQDGAGAVCIKLDMEPGLKYINRLRSVRLNPIQHIFEQIGENVQAAINKDKDSLHDWHKAKANIEFAGELYMGHLRYGTFGKNIVDNLHPVIRQNNWRSRTLVMAGNFNLTNVDEMFNYMVDFGQHPRYYSDTVTALEMVGLYLDEENQKLFRDYKNKGIANKEISHHIEENIDLNKILASASQNWDGGYVMAGMLGHGDTFVMRDPWGIRPAFYYIDDEVAVVASERPAIKTVFNVDYKDIKEVSPGEALIIRKNGSIQKNLVRVPRNKTACSFERIYFSRGTDKDIYLERKKLGELLVPKILEAIDYDFENTVFSFIPNTAETAFYGMLKGLEDYLLQRNKKIISENKDNLSGEMLDQIFSLRPRVEKIAVKDAKLRTFISSDEGRDDLISHVYDVTYGAVVPNKDTLVIIDDSIVRGSTLKDSILKILDRLRPKKIIIVSSAPQIRYPDCYGIDMTKLGEFIAFQAAVELLEQKGKAHILDEIYKKCKAQQFLPKDEIINYVSQIYELSTYEEVSKQVASIIKTDSINAEVEVIYQTVESLHKACPDNLGDWYFTGEYPTPGGNKVLNTSFINYKEGKNERAY
ncbi:MAG: amidophosphoribosyltransferase [Bacteroidales bacterium]|nr:amidophosphoribosyltransferase [Bacteroidales bacterium]